MLTSEVRTHAFPSGYLDTTALPRNRTSAGPHWQNGRHLIDGGLVSRFFLAMIILLSTHSSTGRAEELVWNDPSSKAFLSSSDLSEHGFVALFDGTSLDRWNVQPGHNHHWVIRDGIIDYDGKAEQPKFLDRSLWTKDSFGEVELYAEWRFPAAPVMKPQPIVLFNGDFLLNDAGKRVTRSALDSGDSGILFRGILDCQANIWCQELGSGEINGFRTNRKLSQQIRRSCIPFAKADRPLGEWNGFLISLRDNRMTVVLNGQNVVQSEPLPGLPARGPIGLQHHGDPIQFRNIWVKTIDERK